MSYYVLRLDLLLPAACRPADRPPPLDAEPAEGPGDGGTMEDTLLELYRRPSDDHYHHPQPHPHHDP